MSIDNVYYKEQRNFLVLCEPTKEYFIIPSARMKLETFENKLDSGTYKNGNLQYMYSSYCQSGNEFTINEVTIPKRKVNVFMMEEMMTSKEKERYNYLLSTFHSLVEGYTLFGSNINSSDDVGKEKYMSSKRNPYRKSICSDKSRYSRANGTLTTSTYMINNAIDSKEDDSKYSYVPPTYTTRTDGKYTTRLYDNGNKEWYLNDVLHREDGPAIEYGNGYKSWYIKGKLHREDGPAVIQGEYEAWYLNDVFHREDGPAVLKENGYKSWYLNGISYNEEDYYKMCNIILVNSLKNKNGITLTHDKVLSLIMEKDITHRNGKSITKDDLTKMLNGQYPY